MSDTPAASPPAAASGGRVTGMKIFVRGLKIEAEIGVYAHEHGRTQPLLVDVELDVDVAGAEQLAETVNYETVGRIARDVAAAGHLKLVEAFAEQVARACLEDPRVNTARVRVEKPQALAPAAAAAGAEITLSRV
jgi:dihydroneopterin aldolase